MKYKYNPLLLAGALLSAPVYAEIEPAVGLWMNPLRPGHGLNIQMAGERLTLVLYSYDGEAHPVWYTAVGKPNDTSWQSDLFQYHWNDTQQAATAHKVGTAKLQFDDPTHATFSWQLNEQSGNEAIELAVFAEGVPGQNYTGLWYAPSQPGYGLSFISQGQTIIAMHAHYDAKGDSSWAMGAADAASQPVAITMQRFSGSCLSCPYQAPSAVPSGDFSVSFDSLISGTVTSSVALMNGGAASKSASGVSIKRLTNPVVSQAAQTQQPTDGPFLTVADVRKIMTQAVAEATARGKPGTIAVVDRVGNVLGVFKMTGSKPTITVTTQRVPRVQTGLENVNITPSRLGAIAKAVTGAYLSSKGNAFSTRTANQIVQANFNPGERGQFSGPLFGVQFSSLPCSDLSTRFAEDGAIGPKRSPLGLSADPGGLPLYKNGQVVGGIGAMADGVYGIDTNLGDIDTNDDELIAVAGTFGFTPPTDRRGDHITVEGKLFRYIDRGFKALKSNPQTASDLDSQGELVEVKGYSDGTLVNGTVFETPASGIRADNEFFPAENVFVLVDQNNQNRYPPKSGTALSQAEVRQVLSSALSVAASARAQIRRPLNTAARVTVSVVDVNGDILGVARSPDAPVFGTDVSLQKARTAAFFSSATAAQDLIAATDAIYLGAPGPDNTAFPGSRYAMANYIDAARLFFNDPDVLTGKVAYSDRAGGNLSRPYFPDGINNDNNNGPFSKPFKDWGPFSTGLQTDLIINGVLSHVAFVLDLAPSDVGHDCTGAPKEVLQALLGLAKIPENDFNFGNPVPQIRNGIQIFPGSVPIYRGNQLIGGIGVSGDGVDQDDLIAFLGLHRAGVILGTVNNAPPDIRADNLTPQGVRLRYVQCPIAPFANSEEQNVCHGK